MYGSSSPSAGAAGSCRGDLGVDRSQRRETTELAAKIQKRLPRACARSLDDVAPLSRALSKFPSQQRHHFACEQVQESRLIGTWRVKHQMIEAELHVRPDSVDDFLRVAAHDPARYRTLHRQSIRQAFHLERILDIDFLIGLQRQCSPESRVVARTIEVGVERYLHFDQAVDRVERLAGLLQALIDIRQQGIAVQFRLLAAGTYEALR